MSHRSSQCGFDEPRGTMTVRYDLVRDMTTWSVIP